MCEPPHIILHNGNDHNNAIDPIQQFRNLGPKRLAGFAGLCGKTLAYAHARSGDAMMIGGYIGEDKTFDKIIVEFAERYADRTEKDHAQLNEAINDGAIEVVRDI